MSEIGQERDRWPRDPYASSEPPAKSPEPGLLLGSEAMDWAAGFLGSLLGFLAVANIAIPSPEQVYVRSLARSPSEAMFYFGLSLFVVAAEVFTCRRIGKRFPYLAGGGYAGLPVATTAQIIILMFWSIQPFRL